MATLVGVAPAGISPERSTSGPDGASTVKWTPGLTAAPTCTVTGPVAAPGGTRPPSEVGEADVTVVGVPLKSRVFWPGSELKPVPLRSTAAPTGPAVGLSAVTASGGGACTVKVANTLAGSACPSVSSAPASTVSEQRAANSSG